jgi:hypothetical protein
MPKSDLPMSRRNWPHYARALDMHLAGHKLDDIVHELGVTLARSKQTGKPCRAAAMPNGRCKVHGGKSTGPRTPEGLERSRRANWKHGYYSREAKAERSRLRAAILALRELCHSI